MKISKALRREAVEFAGCMATFWADESLRSHSSMETFSARARNLALDAEGEAIEALGGAADNEGAAHCWAEAQAMLLDGWTP